jgi:tyrosyl-tRNA synthetase
MAGVPSTTGFATSRTPERPQLEIDKDVNTSRTAVENLISRFRRTTDEVVTLEELRSALISGRQLVLKYGVDLTAPTLHLGHAVNLWMYRALQDLGHKVILLLGDFTTRIGDPTGRSRTRPVLTPSEIEENARVIQKQALLVLSSDPRVLEVRRNSEWLNELAGADLLTLMSGVTVERLLSRDMFKRRMREQKPIAAHELVYPLLQGWDSVALDADLTIIGSDQLFNEMMGRELQERRGQGPQVIITTKITAGIDGGEKQSKSLGNYVGLDHSPRDKFGRLMRLPDSLIPDYVEVYTDLDDEDVKRLRVMASTSPFEAKLQMAQAVVDRYHGPEVGERERDWFISTFSRRQVPTDAREVDLERGRWTARELVARVSDPSTSKSAIRRLIEQGGVSLDGEPVQMPDEIVTIASTPRTLRVGKRLWFRLVFKGEGNKPGDPGYHAAAVRAEKEGT